MKRLLLAAALVGWASTAGAQIISQRGFAEGRAIGFPQTAVNDPEQLLGEALVREEVFFRPARWLQFAGGVDLRASSHGHVEDEWRFDREDRSLLRPRVGLRRLTATITAGPLTVDVGKQFIRWARADVLNPIDRFAPRDFMNVIDADYLPVIGVRPSIQLGSETLEVAWIAQLTPSRMPRLDQRWTVLPPEAAGLTIIDAGSTFPERRQYGVRWRHTGRFELGASYVDGFNHLPHLRVLPQPAAEPTVELTRIFPRLQTGGIDAALPTGWFTVKAEAAYFASPDNDFGEYALYVLELERQAGEWLFTVGYAGEWIKDQVQSQPFAQLAFDPERGLAKSVLGRASYTVDPRRTVTIEGAIRQSGDGYFAKGEYSQGLGQHLRLTTMGILIGGEPDDFLGQFDRNSHVTIGLRFSF